MKPIWFALYQTSFLTSLSLRAHPCPAFAPELSQCKKHVWSESTSNFTRKSPWLILYIVPVPADTNSEKYKHRRNRDESNWYRAQDRRMRYNRAKSEIAMNDWYFCWFCPHFRTKLPFSCSDILQPQRRGGDSRRSGCKMLTPTDPVEWAFAFPKYDADVLERR